MFSVSPLNAELFLQWSWWNLQSPNANWAVSKGKKPNHNFFYSSTLSEIPATHLFAYNTNTSLEPVFVSFKYSN